VFLVVVLGLIVASCAGGQRALPSGGPTTAQAVLDLAMARPVPQTLQGMGRLEAYVKKDARKATLLLVVQQPASIQFQALAPTLDLMALLSTDGQRFLSFERGGGQCLTGPACPRNMARLVPIALPPAELAQMLLGRPPILQSGEKTLHWDEERALYRIDIGPADGTHQQVFVRPADPAKKEGVRFAGTVMYRGKERIGSVQYDGSSAGGVPAKLHFKAPDVDVSLELRDVVADQPVQETVFQVQCPEGMKIVELSCEPDAP
jgi:hypothetical protein